MLEAKTGVKVKYKKNSDGFLKFTATKEDGSSESVTLYASCIEAISENNLYGQSAKPTEPTQTKEERHQSKEGEIIGFHELKKMTVVGMEAFKPYRVSAMINALDLGTDGLCEQLRYDGYCELDRERVYVNISLDSTASRSQLYDLRGKRGAAICATVVMHPRNVNGTLNLVGFTPGRCS